MKKEKKERKTKKADCVLFFLLSFLHLYGPNCLCVTETLLWNFQLKNILLYLFQSTEQKDNRLYLHSLHICHLIQIPDFHQTIKTSTVQLVGVLAER